MNQIEQNILKLLNAYTPQAKTLAFQLCVGLAGNYGKEIREILQAPFNYFIAARYGLETTYWQTLEQLDLNMPGEQSFLLQLEKEVGKLSHLKSIPSFTGVLCAVPTALFESRYYNGYEY